MHPKHKGDIAVSKVMFELLKAGIIPLLPVGENTRYNIVGDTGSKLVRIQIKHMYKRKNTWMLKARTTRINSKGNISRQYTKKEIDFLIGYRPDTEDCYIIPVKVIKNRKELVINENAKQKNQFKPLEHDKFKNAWHLLK